uniref:Thioredoxin domain-containing protein n=1 Tax=viral metagenome TaxID=1070528 RepID=A0A6C0JUT2_9ZZZZ
MQFNWKIGALAAVVVGILAYLYFNRTMLVSGFQNKGSASSKPEGYTFTMYYADWCGHCKNAKPGFQSLANSGPVIVNGKKCTVQMVSPEKEPEKAAGKPIKGFPTFLFESPEGQIVEYKGERNTDAYLKFINDALGSGAETTPDAAE